MPAFRRGLAGHQLGPQTTFPDGVTRRMFGNRVSRQNTVRTTIGIEPHHDVLGAGHGHGRHYDAAIAMSAYYQTRDAQVLPTYEFTTQLAAVEAPPAEMQQLLGAVHGNQDAMDDFVSLTAGTVSPVEFFAPENIGRIMSAASTAVTAERTH